MQAGQGKTGRHGRAGQDGHADKLGHAYRAGQGRQAKQAGQRRAVRAGQNTASLPDQADRAGQAVQAGH